MTSPPNQTSGTGTGETIRGELKGDINRLKSSVGKQAEARADQQKARVATTAKSASSAISNAADELRRNDQAPEWLASAFSGAARQIDAFAGQLQDKSPREIAAEVGRFAQQSPTTFLAVSAALGFVAARFIRAGSAYQHEQEAGTDEGYEQFDGYDDAGAREESSTNPSPSSVTTGQYASTQQGQLP